MLGKLTPEKQKKKKSALNTTFFLDSPVDVLVIHVKSPHVKVEKIEILVSA